MHSGYIVKIDQHYINALKVVLLEPVETENNNYTRVYLSGLKGTLLVAVDIDTVAKAIKESLQGKSS
jgi:hypothetical protein